MERLIRHLFSVVLLCLLAGCPGPSLRYEALSDGFRVEDGTGALRVWTPKGLAVEAGSASGFLSEVPDETPFFAMLDDDWLLLTRKGKRLEFLLRPEAGGVDSPRARLARAFDRPREAVVRSTVEDAYIELLSRLEGLSSVAGRWKALQKAELPLLPPDQLDLLDSGLSDPGGLSVSDRRALISWIYAGTTFDWSSWREALERLLSVAPTDSKTLGFLADVSPVADPGQRSRILETLIEERRLAPAAHAICLEAGARLLEEAAFVEMARGVLATDRWDRAAWPHLLSALEKAGSEEQKTSIGGALLDRAVATGSGRLLERTLEAGAASTLVPLLTDVLGRKEPNARLLNVLFRYLESSKLSDDLRYEACHALFGARVLDDFERACRLVERIPEEGQRVPLVQRLLRHPNLSDLGPLRRTMEKLKKPGPRAEALQAVLEWSGSRRSELAWVARSAASIDADDVRLAFIREIMSHAAYGEPVKDPLFELAAAIEEETRRALAWERLLTLPDLTEEDLIRVVEETGRFHGEGLALGLWKRLRDHPLYDDPVREAIKRTVGRLPRTDMAEALRFVLSLRDATTEDVRFCLEVAADLVGPSELLGLYREAAGRGADDLVRKGLREALLDGVFPEADRPEAFRILLSLEKLSAEDRLWILEAATTLCATDPDRVAILFETLKGASRNVRLAAVDAIRNLKTVKWRVRAMERYAERSGTTGPEAVRLIEVLTESIPDDTTRLSLLDRVVTPRTYGPSVLDALKKSVQTYHSGDARRRLVGLVLELPALGTTDLRWAVRVLSSRLTVDSDRRRLFIRIARHPGQTADTFRALLEALPTITSSRVRREALLGALGVDSLTGPMLRATWRAARVELEPGDREAVREAIETHPNATAALKRTLSE